MQSYNLRVRASPPSALPRDHRPTRMRRHPAVLAASLPGLSGSTRNHRSRHRHRPPGRAYSKAGDPRERCAAGGVDADVPGFDHAATAGWLADQGEPGRSAAFVHNFVPLHARSRDGALLRAKPGVTDRRRAEHAERRARSPGSWPRPPRLAGRLEDVQKVLTGMVGDP